MKTFIKTTLIIAVTAMVMTTAGYSQRYMTKNGYIRFYSEAPLENIEAHNRQVNSALDASTGDLVFKVLMQSFEFEKALMQEHFNENYVESHTFPASTFKGKVVNISEIDFNTPGEYPAVIEGDLTIHGVTQPVKHDGTFTVKEDGKVQGTSVFFVKVADYDIKIPGAVANNIAEEIEVTVDVALEPFNRESSTD